MTFASDLLGLQGPTVNTLRTYLDDVSTQLPQCGDARGVLSAQYRALSKAVAMPELLSNRLDQAMLSSQPQIEQTCAEIRANYPAMGRGADYQDREFMIAQKQAAYVTKLQTNLRTRLTGAMTDDAQSLGASLATTAAATKKWLCAKLTLSGNPLEDVLTGGDTIQRLQMVEQLKRTCKTMTFLDIQRSHQAKLDLDDEDGATALEMAAAPIAIEALGRPETSDAGDPDNIAAKQARDLLNQFRTARASRRPSWVNIAVGVADKLQAVYEGIIGQAAVDTRRPAFADFPSAFVSGMVGHVPMMNMSSGPKTPGEKPLVYRDADGNPVNPHAR